MSLEPAAAALAALVVLGEQLSAVEIVAMACVIVASVGATRTLGKGRRRTESRSVRDPGGERREQSEELIIRIIVGTMARITSEIQIQIITW